VRENGTIGGEEALGVPGQLETLHPSFPLARRLVRVLGAIIEVSVPAMFHAGQYLPLGGAVALQLVGDMHPWDVLASFEQHAEELLGYLLAAPTLHENIKDVAVLIYRTPEIVTCAVAREKHLLTMPRISRLGPSAS
jgi:hypothetical protein